MAAQPAGEESCRTPLRQVDRGAAVLRPDQATRGRVGRAPGQAREMHWRQAPPAQEGHPGSADSTLSTQAPAQPTSSDFTSQRPSYRPPVGAASKKTSRAGLHHARPSVLAASASNPASSWAPVSASLFGQPQATLTYVRVPLHPERGGRAPSRVRDRARQGRNGAAGSSGAEEPGPKGDAKLSWPFMEGPMRNKLW